MGLICEYFAAPSDDAAAATIDRDGGPSSAVAAPPAQRRGLFGRRAAPSVAPGPVEVYPTVEGLGIEPVVQMGTLEALLTGHTYDDVMEEHPGGNLVAVRDKGERIVARLSGALTGALAGASDDELSRVAVPWSETEEFWGNGEPEALAGFLVELAGLARLAGERGHGVYCWLSV